MSKKLYEESNLQAIANAIREKNNTQNQYTPSQMPNAILQIHGEPNLETLTVTENGNYLPSANKDGFSEVAVSVPNSYANSDEGKVVKNGSLISQTPRAAGITENGTYDTTENNSVVVNVPTGSGVVQPLSVTQNGTYNPPSGVDGYAPVTVNVSSGGGSGDEPTVYWGDEAPLSNLGNDGDVYICGDNIYIFRDSNNKFLKAVNKDYVVTSTSQILSTHSSVFQKTVEGPAIAIECQTHSYYGYKGPILISTVEDYVKYTDNTKPWGHIDVDDVTWYIGNFRKYDLSSDSPTIPTYYNLCTDLGNVPSDFDSAYASALIRKFLELAAPSSYGSVYVKRSGTWELMAKELNLETLDITRNGVYVPSLGKDGFGEVRANVLSANGFEIYTADSYGGQRIEHGFFDNQYFVCFFDDNMSNTYTLNGVSDTYSTLATGRTGNNGLKATTRGVTNSSASPSNAIITKEGSLFSTTHDDYGSYISVVGGWVGFPAGGTIYESAAVGTSNSITLNSAHETLLIFIGATSNVSGITTVGLNGVTYPIVNIGSNYGVYGMYTAIRINRNTNTNITVTFPESCWSYVSVIGIDS